MEELEDMPVMSPVEHVHEVIQGLGDDKGKGVECECRSPDLL